MGLHQRTSDWLVALVQSGQIYTRWLRRLYWAEYGGAGRFRNIVEQYQLTGETHAVFEGIIADELRHKGLVEALLAAKGIAVPETPGLERYWDPVWSGIASFQDACAAGAFGEMLARNRFDVIAKHPITPEDIRSLVQQILPDEERHARLLGELAGPEAMNRMRPYHKKGMAALGLIDEE